MLEALATALAQLVALEARFTELVEPEKAIFDAVRGVVKEITIVVPQLVEKVAALEARVAEIEHAPAIESDVRGAAQQMSPTAIEVRAGTTIGDTIIGGSQLLQDFAAGESRGPPTG